MNARKAISEQPSMTWGARIGLFLFGLVFFSLGSMFFWLALLKPFLDHRRAQSWETTRATITTSKVHVNHDSDGDTYAPEIHFEYLAQNQVYQSETYSFNVWSGSRGLGGFRCGCSSRLAVNIPCYYDPLDPTEAVLDRSFSYWNFLGLFTLLFVGVGAVALWASVFGGSSAEYKPVSSSQKAPLSSVASTHEVPWQDFEGPQRLKSESSPLGRAIGLGITALIWNAIVGVVVYYAVGDGAGTFIMIFLSLFVLAGVAIFVGFIHQVLACFNPKVEIALSNGAVPLGGTADLAWETNGNVSRITENEDRGRGDPKGNLYTWHLHLYRYGCFLSHSRAGNQ